MDESTPIKMIYSEWKKSGKTQREFCEEKGLRLSWFKYHLFEERRLGVLGDGDEIGFVPVQIADTERKAELQDAYCEILFYGKQGIRIETLETVACIKSLMAVVMGQ